MKRRIAVFANGWNNLAIEQALKGIRSVTDKLNIDIFMFLSFAAYNQPESALRGEDAIFDLPDYTDFDGAIIFSNMLNSDEPPRKIAKKLVENNVCGVSVGLPMEGLSLVGIDNYKGMYELINHLVKEHHIKNPAFFAGTRVHPDSNERIQATKEALEKNGLNLNPENIVYTDWEYIKSLELAIEFAKRPNPPDSFICANDYIAIAVCVGLKKLGYSVPKDFIVTGFDKISFAETFYPSITTVYQDYEKLGYIAAWQLLEKINGTEKSEKVVVSSKFVQNESCGCKKENEAETVRHEFCITSFTKEMEWLVFQGQEVEMTGTIFNASNYKQLAENVLKFYSNNKPLNQNDFYFVLDSKARRNLISSSFQVQKKYSETMNCLVSVKDGKAKYEGEFKRVKLIPGYKKKKTPCVYVFTPLHFEDLMFGYVVLKDAMQQIKDTTLNHYMSQMNYNIEQFRKNSRLEEMNKVLRNISNTDQLTGLNNRLGMESNGVPLMEKAHKAKKSCAVVFTDINQMKYINDNFGHLQGDLAIRTVASALLSEMPDKWIGIRYGGDEFIALGVCNDKELVEEYIERIQINLEKQVSSMRLSYPLSTSCGYVLTDPALDFSLNDYISQADDYMYEQKQKAKKNAAKIFFKKEK
ncbi:MAG: GGDEF domain-containing protein [Treponema sp.]|nr:GGDEF domain-containing protein [Treponema sp.]